MKNLLLKMKLDCEKLKRVTATIVLCIIIGNMIEVPVYVQADSYESVCEYPISIYSEEWDDLTYEKKLELCNLPTYLLEKMSTEELAELVLNYPFLIDVFTFESAENLLRHFEETSSVMKEFFSRSDSQDVLMEKYSDLNVNYSKLSDENNANKSTVIYDSGYIKEVFLQTYFSTKILTMEENCKEKLIGIIEEKHKSKKGFCEDYASAYTIYEHIQREEGCISRDIIPESMLGNENFLGIAQDVEGTQYMSSAMSATEIKCNPVYEPTTYTKYGVTVKILLFKSDDFTYEEKQIINSAIMEAYPTWILKATATLKYNCHSYAWISTDTTSNKYWLGSPDKFSESKAYFDFVGTNVMPKKGDKIIIAGSMAVNAGFGETTYSVHSMIAEDDNGTVISKVGQGGVYKTTLQEMMTYYAGLFYNVYRMK